MFRARANAASVLLALALLACGDGERRPTAKAPAQPQPLTPDLRLVVMTDLGGYLEPCGCQSRPLGGIDKAAAQLETLRADGVPTLFVHAGSLLFDGSGAAAHGTHGAGGADAERRVQDRLQAETLLAVLGRMGLDASALGSGDLAYGPTTLDELVAKASFPRLRPPKPAIILARGRSKVGLLAHRVDGGAGAARALNQAATRLRAEGAQVVVALLDGDARGVRRLAGALEGVDFAVHAGANSSEHPAPETVGSTVLLRAGQHGEGMLVADLSLRGSGAFTDVSAWTREAQLSALSARIDDLAERIRGWEHEGKGDSPDVARQRGRLEQLRTERARAATPQSVDGRRFEARFIELGPEIGGAASVRALLEAHDKRVNEHNREALAARAPLPVPAGQPGYAGSSACGECHESEYAWWEKHAHGTAYHTLEERNKQWNLSCVSCHVTGYGKPGGAAIVQNEGLTNVGCESCHGPGAMHVEDQDVDDAQNVRAEVPEATCKECHNAEHSDTFDYATYKAKLIVPGHGKRLEAPQ